MNMEYAGKIIYDDKLYEDRQFIIYGFGMCGKKIYDYMKQIGKEDSVIGFCDKNAANILENDHTILLPDIAFEIPKVDFLVAGKYEYDMINNLLKHNISRFHILSL